MCKLPKFTPRYEWLNVPWYDEVPISFKFYNVKASSGYNIPVTFTNGFELEMKVWCEEDRDSGVAKPRPGEFVTPTSVAAGSQSWGLWETTQFHEFEFHSLPALEAVPASKPGTIFIAIRFVDKLYRIEAKEKSVDRARTAALKYAEYVYTTKCEKVKNTQ